MTTLTRRGALAAALAIACLPVHGSEPASGELLMQPVPEGFVPGHSADNGREAIAEFVPDGETVQDWNRMLTVQVFRRLAHVTPAQWYENMARMWENACPDAQATPLNTGQDHGYPAGQWMQLCPHNPATGRPEVTFFKYIQGRDSAYAVHAATRFVPDETQMRASIDWLKSVYLCDTRIAESGCFAEPGR